MSDPIKADCLKTYFPASRTSGHRGVEVIKWIVMHVTEGDTAAGAARWFKNPTPCNDGGPCGSAHLVVDNDVCYRCLDNDVIPWGAHGANLAGFHIEEAGWAAWSREKWLTEHDATLRRGAYKAAYHCHLFKLPTGFRWASDLKKGYRGVTTHHQCVLAFGGDHTCPGVNWPKDKFMEYVRFYYSALEGGV